MRSAIARVTLKIIELLGCVACFVTKIITDLEARRVFLRNQKYSREWSLLHNITWSKAGNTFANVTYGGFSLITTLMLISRCIDANSRPSLIEKIFLIVGMLCFFAMGGLVLAAFDQVPWELHDNSIILGCLSFFTALVMLYDLSDPMARLVTDTTQTDNDYTTSHHVQTSQQQSQQENHTQTQPQQQLTISSPEPTQVDSATTNAQISETSTQTSTTKETAHPTKVFQETVVKTHAEPLRSAPESTVLEDIAQNGNYRRGDTIDFVHYQRLPQPEQPVFERVLLPEKKRPTYNKVGDLHKSVAIQTVHPDEYVVREHTNYRSDHVDSSIHQMPKYAAIQRQQYVEHPTYAPSHSMMHSYKLNPGYGNDYESPPREHVVKTTRPDHVSRYRDPAPEHHQPQPMMVIRKYAQPTASRPTAHKVVDRRHQQTNDYMYRPHGINGTKRHGAQSTQHGSHKTGCCTQSTDDEIDFRKMNSAIRPGFVDKMSKLWDRRAVENQSGEFNTIV